MIWFHGLPLSIVDYKDFRRFVSGLNLVFRMILRRTISVELRSTVMSPEGVSLDNRRFSQEVSRKELTRMIWFHGLPLSIVNYKGF
jgi:hypothetical protein